MKALAIESICDDIETAIQRSIGAEDPNKIALKLEYLSTMVGNLPTMLAHSEKAYMTYWESIDDTPTKAKIKAQASEEYALFNRVRALDKELHYAIDALRSLFASARKDMRNE